METMYLPHVAGKDVESYASAEKAATAASRVSVVVAWREEVTTTGRLVVTRHKSETQRAFATRLANVARSMRSQAGFADAD